MVNLSYSGHRGFARALHLQSRCVRKEGIEKSPRGHSCNPIALWIGLAKVYLG